MVFPIKSECFSVRIDSAVPFEWELAAEKGVLRPLLLVGEADEIESDYQLGLWLNGIFHYLRLYSTKNPVAMITRFVMDRAILQMNPSQRKICLMLMRFTILEVIIIITIGIGAYFFMR